MNPNSRINAEVLKPYWNGDDLTGRTRDMWFIDLPLGLREADAALWEAPFDYLSKSRDEAGKSLRELRSVHGFAYATEHWWEPWRPRPEMRRRIENLSRYIVTAETAEYRLFVWLRFPILPDMNLIVIPREDDVTFGILQSRFHEAWALRKGSDLEDRPRYTSTTTFETFPLAEGMTLNLPPSDQSHEPIKQAVAAAAMRLNELRSNWLNPADLVRIEPEVVAGFPDRILPRDAHAAAALRQRTLTNLYNQRPQWLIEAHRNLDVAVAAAYGWPADIPEDDALANLLELNLRRAGTSNMFAGEESRDEDQE